MRSFADYFRRRCELSFPREGPRTRVLGLISTEAGKDHGHLVRAGSRHLLIVDAAQGEEKSSSVMTPPNILLLCFGRTRTQNFGLDRGSPNECAKCGENIAKSA